MPDPTPVPRRKLFLDTGYSVVILALAGLFGYVYNVTLANRLSPAEFGSYSALLSIVYWLQVMMTTTQNLLTKIVGHYHDYNLTGFRDWVVRRFSLVALVGVVLIIVFHQPLAYALRIEPGQALFLTFPVAMAALGAIAKGFFFGKQRIKTANTLSFLETVPEVVGGFFVATAKQGIALYSLATLVVNSLAIPFIKFDRHQRKITPEPVRLRTYLQILVILLLMNMPFTLDVLLINPSLRPEYAALSLLGKGIFFTSSVVSLIMFANLSRRQSEPHRKKILLLSLAYAALVGIVFVVGYYFNQSLILNFVFKEKYASIGPYVGMYSVGMTLFGLAYVLSNYLVVINYYKHWIGILVVIAIQIILFSLGLNSITMVVVVQITVYAILLVVLAGYTSYTFMTDYGVKRVRKPRLPAS